MHAGPLAVTIKGVVALTAVQDSMPGKVIVVVATVVVLAVIAFVGVFAWWASGWNQCASEVDGRLVEHHCDEEPSG